METCSNVQEGSTIAIGTIRAPRYRWKGTPRAFAFAVFLALVSAPAVVAAGLSVIFCTLISRLLSQAINLKGADRATEKQRARVVHIGDGRGVCGTLGTDHGDHRRNGDRSSGAVVPNVSITVTSKAPGSRARPHQPERQLRRAAAARRRIQRHRRSRRASRRRPLPASCWRSIRSRAWTSCSKWAR